jgi:branched-chain amino acid transport system permease protein
MFGVMRIANLANGDLMILGGFAASLAAQYLHIPVWATILVAIALLAALG